MRGSEDYREYCAQMKAQALKVPYSLRPCRHYVPRPGWEVKGCHSCKVNEANEACEELCHRFGELLPCVKRMAEQSYGGTE